MTSRLEMRPHQSSADLRTTWSRSVWWWGLPGPGSWAGRRGRPTAGLESGRTSGSRRWRCCGTLAARPPAEWGVDSDTPAGRCPAWSGSCPSPLTGSSSGGCVSFLHTPPACWTPPQPLWYWLERRHKQAVDPDNQYSLHLYLKGTPLVTLIARLSKKWQHRLSL